MRITLIFMLVLLSGCAVTSPPVSELRDGIQSATFVQYGMAPRGYSFGVVDTKSFWATYGNDIGANVGGTAVAGVSKATMAATGAALSNTGTANRSAMLEEARKDIPRSLISQMIDEQAFTATLADAALAKVASAWQVAFSPDKIMRLESDPAYLTGDVYTGPHNDTDIVVVYTLGTVSLNEKATMKGAFAAGFTMGMNEKKVAPEVYGNVRVYKRDIATGNYNEIWLTGCSTTAMQAKQTKAFPWLVRNPAAGRSLFEAAMPTFRNSCNPKV